MKIYKRIDIPYIKRYRIYSLISWRRYMENGIFQYPLHDYLEWDNTNESRRTSGFRVL